MAYRMSLIVCATSVRPDTCLPISVAMLYRLASLTTRIPPSYGVCCCRLPVGVSHKVLLFGVRFCSWATILS
jgi:hypothetical protein